MVLVHCPSSQCHLSIKQVSFQSLCTFQDMARTGIHYENKWLKGDNSVNIPGKIVYMGPALPLIAIYLYTKFYLNANSSFKLFAGQGTGRMDGQTDRQSSGYMLPLWGA